METRSLRDLVLNYLGKVCVYCGAVSNLDIHHITPLYAGGRNSMGNVEVVCRSCHKKLHVQLSMLYPTQEQGKSIARQSLREESIAALMPGIERNLEKLRSFKQKE